VSEFDAAEDGTATAGAEAELTDVALEAPEADAVEQHTPVADADEDTAATAAPAPDAEANDADTAEQLRVVDYDEDDYR
jgi:hypothetical protein